MRWFSLLLLGLLGGAAAAQSKPTGEDVATEIVVQNLVRHAREEWASAVVPFATGAIAKDALPDLHADGCATVWQPFGARWPDGSLRQALCLFRLPLEAMSERRLRLLAGKGPDLPAGAIALPEGLRLVFTVQRAGTTVEAAATPVRTLEANAARRVELWRCRLGDSGLLCEVLLTVWHGQAHLGADVAVFFSDPRSPAMACAIDELTVSSHGLALVLRHAARFGVRAVENAEKDGSTCSLLRSCQLGDGQGIRRTGVLVPKLDGQSESAMHTLVAATVCPVLAATDAWTRSGAYGAFGVVPGRPPGQQHDSAARAALAQRHAAFVRDDAAGRSDPFWCGPLSPARNPSQTGDQNDFGVAMYGLVAGTGLPSMLLEAEASVLQEACRPVHNFEADGEPVLAERHPDWVVWSGRTHWHCEVSKDRLGKPCPVPNFERNGWSGKDREHWSTNYAGGYYLLTGAHWLRRELENETQLFLAGETIDGKYTTSGAGAARGVGRTLQAGCWLYLATGDERLARRIGERLEHILWPSWEFRDQDATRVRPIMVCSPDPRMLDGKHGYWNPWQEAIAVTGLAAAHRLTGDAKARALAAGIGTNVVRHGFKVDDRGAIIATAIQWRDGEPISEAELLAGDKSLVVWSHGTAFSEWALPAVAMTKIYAEEDGDTETAARAERILGHLRGSHSARLPEWDCVR